MQLTLRGHGASGFQVGIEVTSVKKESLPSGASVIYTSPYNAAVFAIKFCEAENPVCNQAEQSGPLIGLF